MSLVDFFETKSGDKDTWAARVGDPLILEAADIDAATPPPRTPRRDASAKLPQELTEQAWHALGQRAAELDPLCHSGGSGSAAADLIDIAVHHKVPQRSGFCPGVWQYSTDPIRASMRAKRIATAVLRKLGPTPVPYPPGSRGGLGKLVVALLFLAVIVNEKRR